MSNYAFDFGNDGVLVVSAQWTPDPDAIEAEMVKMADSFADWTAPMQEAKQVMIANTRRRFRTESNPDGSPWERLSDDYWHEKVELGGYPDEILVRTRNMYTAATSEEAWLVTERDIFFNAEALPKTGDGFNYGMAHQSGAERARGGRLPQRMFIGADEEAANEIEAIFLRHLDRTVIADWDDPLPPGPEFVVGMYATTTTGLEGKLSSARSLTPGFRMVKGAGGRFIGHTFVGEGEGLP